MSTIQSDKKNLRPVKSPRWSIAHEIRFFTQAYVFEGDVDKKIEAAKGVTESL